MAEHGKIIFDYTTGEPVFALDDNAAITKDGEYLFRVSDNIAGDISGNAHFISDWDDEDDDSFDKDDMFDADDDW